jgi:hypothetical protein
MELATTNTIVLMQQHMKEGKAGTRELYRFLLQFLRGDIASFNMVLVSIVSGIAPDTVLIMFNELLPFIDESLELKSESVRKKNRRDVLRHSIAQLLEASARSIVAAFQAYPTIMQDQITYYLNEVLIFHQSWFAVPREHSCPYVEG